MDTAASCGQLQLVKFFHATALTECTTAAMDNAAARGDLEMIKFLHQNRAEGCTVKAMDWAAANGQIEVVKFLHENRTEGCTVDAMDLAASNGHLHVVEFLHQHRTEGCTTDAMDNAAEQNHLDVVRFLHENRTEGCTHQAMDRPSSVGTLRYLLENRSERSTVAVVRWVSSYALEANSVMAMELLYRHRPDLFTVEVLGDVLTSGCFELWKTLRSKFGCDDSNDGARDAIEFAAKTYRLHIIRFLLCNERRTHLVVPAVITSLGYAPWTRDWKLMKEWLTLLTKLAGDPIPIAEIVEQCITHGMIRELSRLIPILSKSAEDLQRNAADALSVLRAHNTRSHTADIDLYLRDGPLESMEYFAHEEISGPQQPLALEPDLPSWVYHELYAHCSRVLVRWAWQCPSDRLGQPTWIKGAIMHEDLAFVQRLHRLSQDEKYRDDPKFSFKGAGLLAAYLGQHETLQWLIAEVPEEVPTDVDLLDATRSRKNKEIIGFCGRCLRCDPWDWMLHRPCGCKHLEMYHQRRPI